MGSRVAEVKQEVHRPGVYKQQNKQHKHGRHRTKSQLDAANKGQVAVKVVTKRARRELKRQERRNQALQIRARKREDFLTRKRGLDGNDNAPFVIAVISLSTEIDPHTLMELIKTCDSEADFVQTPNGQFHLGIPRFKQRFTFIIVPSDDVYAVLDAAKVAESILFLYPLNGDVDPDTEIMFAALYAQGLPATIHAAVCPSSVPQKKRNDLKRNVLKVVDKKFPKEKLHFVEKESDALLLIRQIGSQKMRSVYFRDKRSHMLAEAVEFVDEEGDTGTLKISGYVYGRDFSADGLVHIPFWGTYQLSQVDVLNDPRWLGQRRKNPNKREMAFGDPVIMVDKPNAEKQETLESENVPDPMEGEQTWPTEEELKLAEEEQKKRKIRVPKGTSDYQAAWILENSDVESESDGNGDDEMVIESQMEAMDDDNSEDDDDGDEEYETITVTDAGDDAVYDERMDLNEEKEMLQKFKDARTDEMFPDEVDTPLHIPAKTRFQKYRGLKSFRTSAWDPKENLPTDYSRLFQFQSFDRTRKRILSDASESNGAAMRDWYVTLHVKDFPLSKWASCRVDYPLVVYQPLPYEQKMSVLNMVVKRYPHNTEPIRSKDKLVFHVGYRRFSACPIFSQHTNGTKHKYERYFRNDTIMVATVYGPIMFSPCPVLVFKEKADGSHDLVATGSVLNVNPDRIVSKRAVLSGHPLKINKRSAVVRYMFFNNEDIEWFKPVELRTKCGRRGHIKESLGTHGHMKCYFDGQLQSQDTVMMNLYKRVFPKWTYEPLTGYPIANGKISIEDEMEDVENCALFE